MKRVQIKLLFRGNALRGCSLTRQSLESKRRYACKRVPNIPVAQVLLDKARIAPFIGQCEPATVSEHVRMNLHTQTGARTDFRAYAVESLPCHRASL
jgi:hypothetical protein